MQKYNMYTVCIMITSPTNYKSFHQGVIAAYSAEDALFQAKTFYGFKLKELNFLVESYEILDIYPFNSKLREQDNWGQE